MMLVKPSLSLAKQKSCLFERIELIWATKEVLFLVPIFRLINQKDTKKFPLSHIYPRSVVLRKKDT